MPYYKTDIIDGIIISTKPTELYYANTKEVQPFLIKDEIHYIIVNADSEDDATEKVNIFLEQFYKEKNNLV